MKPYVPGRDGRFEYAHDATAHVEAVNCSRGCQVAPSDATPDEPGGSCGVLAAVFLAEPVAELDDQGDRLVCITRQPLPKPEPRRIHAGAVPAGPVEGGLW